MENRVVLAYINPLRKPPVAPIGLDYLASALRRSGFEADVLDLCLAEDVKETINQYFAENEVLAVGASLRDIDNMSIAAPEFYLPFFKEVVELIKAKTSAPIILGGSGFSLMPETILDYCEVDLGIYGEGEDSFPLLLNKIQRGINDFHDIPNLVYRFEGRIRRNPIKQVDLFNLPAPEREAINNQLYFLESGVAGVECRRSCTKHCIYCPDPWIKGAKLRYRSPDSVAAEIENLLRQGIDHIYFCDSEFNVPDERYARELCLKLIERGLNSRIKWFADILPVPFPEELASLFLKAGCGGVAFNIDVFSGDMLRNMGRDFTPEDIIQAAEVCHRQNLPFVYYLLLGGPGETKETLKETIENVKRTSPGGVVTVLGIRLLPGTKLAEEIKRGGLLSENPNLQGEVTQNDELFKPIWYVSSTLGSPESAREYIAELIGEDESFFFRRKKTAESPGNPGTANEILAKAIKEGYRGIYWDILRRLREEGKLKRWLKEGKNG